jgi:hypothetical protein
VYSECALNYSTHVFEEIKSTCHMTLILTHFRKSTEEKMQDSPFSLQEKLPTVQEMLSKGMKPA